MSGRIQVGDLVAVIRESPCVCGRPSSDYQSIFRVGRIRMSDGRRCHECRRTKPDVLIAEPEGFTPGDLIYALSRLKRIPPLGELEGEKQKEDIREPA